MIQNLGKTRKKGAAILIAIILCAVMLFAAIALSMTSVSQIKIAQATKTSNVAYQIADAGMEEILRVILQEFNPPTGLEDLEDIQDAIGGDSAISDGEITNTININGSSDQGEYTVSFFNSSGDQLEDNSDLVSEVFTVRCQGVYKTHARVVETTIEPAGP